MLKCFWNFNVANKNHLITVWKNNCGFYSTLKIFLFNWSDEFEKFTVFVVIRILFLCKLFFSRANFFLLWLFAYFNCVLVLLIACLFACSRVLLSTWLRSLLHTCLYLHFEFSSVFITKTLFPFFYNCSLLSWSVFVNQRRTSSKTKKKTKTKHINERQRKTKHQGIHL